MENFKLNWWWLIDIWKTDTDYTFWTSSIAQELLSQRQLNRQPVFEYNQWALEETAFWCTIFSWITELSYLKNKQFVIDQVLEIWRQMVKDWKLNPRVWAYLKDAIHYIYKWWNAYNPKDKINYYSIDYADTELMNLMTHEISVWLTQLWYRTSTELYLELEKTWHASKKDYLKWWWHAVSKYWYNIIDNYKDKKKNNRYSFDYFEDLLANNVIMKYWYIFVNT